MIRTIKIVARATTSRVRRQSTLRTAKTMLTLPRATVSHTTTLVKQSFVLDSRTRNRPSFLPENVQVCVETEVNRPKREGSAGHGGDADQICSATSYSSDAPSPRTRAQARWVTRLQDLVHRGDELRGDHIRITYTVSVPLQSPVCVARTPRRLR